MTTVRRVWKYEIPIDDQSHPAGFWPIHVAAKDARTLYVWCEVETKADEAPTLEPHRVFGTGQPIPPGAAHVGSVVVENLLGAFVGPPLVWHLYNMEMVPPTVEAAL